MDDELVQLLASTVTGLGLDLVDPHILKNDVRGVVDREGGADVDSIAAATRAISALLDEHDPQPGRRYTLEVSSPGLERALRSPQQFRRAVGEKVTVRTTSGGEGERRLTGRLVVADETGIVLEGDDLADGRAQLPYEQIQRARTVFEWPVASRASESSNRSSSPRRARKRRGGDIEKVTTP